MEKTEEFNVLELQDLVIKHNCGKKHSCTGKIKKQWTSYREKYLDTLEIQEGACTFAPQTLNMIERLSAESFQQKQGLRENHSTFARVKD